MLLGAWEALSSSETPSPLVHGYCSDSESCQHDPGRGQSRQLDSQGQSSLHWASRWRTSGNVPWPFPSQPRMLQHREVRVGCDRQETLSQGPYLI